MNRDHTHRFKARAWIVVAGAFLQASCDAQEPSQCNLTSAPASMAAALPALAELSPFCPLFYGTDTEFLPYQTHGEYSATYLGSWGGLGTGLTTPLAPSVPYEDVTLEDLDQNNANTQTNYKLWYTDTTERCEDVWITGADIPPLRVFWNAATPGGHWETSLVLIQNKRNVVIDGLFIKQMGGQSAETIRSSKHTIFVDGCEQLIIRNSYFAGPVGTAHIKVQGCQQVFIENVEIDGVPYLQLVPDSTETAKVSGAGVVVLNGDSKVDCSNPAFDCTNPEDFSEDYDCGALAPGEAYADRSHIYPCAEGSTCYAQDLRWLVIQNSTFHGYEYSPDGLVDENHDAIAVSSPADGLIFNNSIYDWDAGDSLIDVDHRRVCDKSYAEHTFRIERNSLAGHLIKTPGISDTTNKLIYANNIFWNTTIHDYHRRHPVYYVHNTFLFDDDTGSGTVFIKQQSRYTEPTSAPSDGSTYLFQNLIRSQTSAAQMTYGLKFVRRSTVDLALATDWKRKVQGDHNLFMLHALEYMFYDGDNYGSDSSLYAQTLLDWQSRGTKPYLDIDSVENSILSLLTFNLPSGTASVDGALVKGVSLGTAMIPNFVSSFPGAPIWRTLPVDALRIDRDFSGNNRPPANMTPGAIQLP